MLRDQESKRVAFVSFVIMDTNFLSIELQNIVSELFTKSSNGKSFPTLSHIAFSQHRKVYIRSITIHTNAFVQHQSGLPPFAMSHRTHSLTQAPLEFRAQSRSLSLSHLMDVHGIAHTL